MMPLGHGRSRQRRARIQANLRSSDRGRAPPGSLPAPKEHNHVRVREKARACPEHLLPADTADERPLSGLRRKVYRATQNSVDVETWLLPPTRRESWAR